MPLVSAYCHCASKHLHRDAHAVTWILSFYSLIWITSLFSRLVRQVQCTYSNQGHKGKSKHSNFVYVITQILYIAMVVNFIFFYIQRGPKLYTENHRVKHDVLPFVILLLYVMLNVYSDTHHLASYNDCIGCALFNASHKSILM